MLKLKKVSKYYYSKGMVATGFTRANLELNLGEFVAITGESGSGKSTLLNVISGLDSYEEGEMYINGEETSHYSELDYEIYRKKYIGNIFQNFNLINSYTVYQNVELVLLINGYKRKDIKYKVIDIIKKVGLIKYKNTKVSKLSGGQKQRVAIARCLAKDTPIIIADEPTGNLDTKSAESILKLLNEISETKLVIVVTHNYDQVEKYVTRKITMHDGRIIEDRKIKNAKIIKDADTSIYQNTKLTSKIRLGIRNTFNIVPKFLLMLMVYLFIIFSVSGTYSSFQKGEYEASKESYSPYFSGKNADKRIILKKKDGQMFNDEDYNKIEKLKNIDYLLKEDLLYDKETSIYNDNVYLYGNLVSYDLFDKKVDLGRLPENENEIVIEANKNEWMIANMSEEILAGNFSIENMTDITTGNSYMIKIVGIKYKDSGYQITAYLNNSLLEKVKEYQYSLSNKITYTYASKEYESYSYDFQTGIIPSSYVPNGEVFISKDRTYNCKNNKCINENMNIKSQRKFTLNELNLRISNEYTKNTMNKLTGLDYETYNGAVFISNEDYKSLFKENSYQISAFVKNDKLARDTEKELIDMGYDTFYILDGVVDSGVTQIIKISKLIVLSLLIIVLFFVSYFVIKLILKSRNIYFSTVRMLGSSRKVAKNLLDIELLTITNIAFFIFLTLIILVKIDIINFSYIKDLTTYLSLKEYTIIYLILIFMSYLTSTRYASKLFKKSAISTYREEV